MFMRVSKKMSELKTADDKELHKDLNSCVEKKQSKEEIINLVSKSIKSLPEYIDLDKLIEFDLKVNFSDDNPIVINVLIDGYGFCNEIVMKTTIW